jgi:hypothetical protein
MQRETGAARRIVATGSREVGGCPTAWPGVEVSLSVGGVWEGSDVGENPASDWGGRREEGVWRSVRAFCEVKELAGRGETDDSLRPGERGGRVCVRAGGRAGHVPDLTAGP